MDMKSLSFFVIEDNRFVVDEIISSLRKNNDLEVADNLKSAREKLRQNKKKYDCFIVDMGLPDGWGYELIKEIREDDSFYNKDTPIIVHTSHIPEYEVVRFALENGGDYYMQKSLDYSNFKNQIIDFLSKKRKIDLE